MWNRLNEFYCSRIFSGHYSTRLINDYYFRRLNIFLQMTIQTNNLDIFQIIFFLTFWPTQIFFIDQMIKLSSHQLCTALRQLRFGVCGPHGTNIIRLTLRFFGYILGKIFLTVLITYSLGVYYIFVLKN